MSKNTERNIRSYDENAEKLAGIYNGLSTKDVLPDFVREILSYENKDQLTVLDLGCGSGRDTKWLADQGFKQVVGVDGSEKLLDEAEKHQAHPKITFMQDEAPFLSNLKEMGIKFDVILMGAFVFHFDKEERAELFESIKELANEKAYIHMSLRHGPTPSDGRRMYNVPLSELKEFASANRMSFNHLARRDDESGRADVKWDYVDLHRPAQKSSKNLS